MFNINWPSVTTNDENCEIMEPPQNGLVIIYVNDRSGCISNFSYNINIPNLGDANFNVTSNAFSIFGFCY